MVRISCSHLYFKSLQLSDLDARVLDELLKDPRFLESLVEQRVQLEGDGGDDDEYEGAKNITDVEDKQSTKRGLAVGGEMARGKRSVYESVTMQVVEELQDSARGFLAKISAAFESAGDTGLLFKLVARYRQQPFQKHCCIVFVHRYPVCIHRVVVYVSA